jgi:hypothetical protein
MITRVSTLGLTLGLLAIIVLWMSLATFTAGVTGLELLVGLMLLMVGGAVIFLRHRNHRVTPGAN